MFLERVDCGKMGANKDFFDKTKLFYYNKGRYNSNDFWKPGQSLTDEDLELLKEVKEVYQRQGYVPSKKEVSNVSDLKMRFRTWGNVLKAAGLPSLQDPEETKKRQKAKIIE